MICPERVREGCTAVLRGLCGRRLVAVIGILPIAIMRNCPETASRITRCDCAWSQGRTG